MVEVTGDQVIQVAGYGLEITSIYALYGSEAYLHKVRQVLQDQLANKVGSAMTRCKG